MKEDRLTEAVASELRAMAIAGADVPTLLRRIQQMVGRTDCKLISVQCFRRAFNASVASVSPAAGWHGFGHDLTDLQVNDFLLPIVEEYRMVSHGDAPS